MVSYLGCCKDLRNSNGLPQNTVTESLGAQRYEHLDERHGYRNGYPPLTADDVHACMAYAAALAHEELVPLAA